MNTQIMALMFLAVIMMATGVQSYLNEEDVMEAQQLAEFTELCRRPQYKELCAKLGEHMDENTMEVKEKRKPSFVRFGKRSVIEMEKRKPSFVRFGRK